jgi:hypothetical protein
MAKLVLCRTCGKEVSNAAGKCPHCGQGRPARMPRGVKIFLGAVAGLFVFGLIVAFISDDEKNAAFETGHSYLVAKEGRVCATIMELVDANDMLGCQVVESGQNATILEKDAALVKVRISGGFEGWTEAENLSSSN